MTIDDVKSSIKNHVLNSISQRDLSTLCNIFSIPINTQKKFNQKNVVDSILLSNDLALLHHILMLLNKSDKEANTQVSTQIQPGAQNLIRMPPQQSSNLSFSLSLRLYSLSSELLNQCPIDLKDELVSGVNPQNIFVPNFTRYPDGCFNAPICPPSLVNGRMNMPNAQLPYVSKSTTIKTSPFYCCQVVLHPLSLLIPKPTPNICQPNRIMSKIQLNFTLSSSVRQLINANRLQINNKHIYKWQILLRFGVYDPVKPFPTQNNDISSITEYIPPYLSLSVNGIVIQLWDILPSNTIAKEGKRVSRPINITEHIKYTQADDRGYRQVISINWWQTPGVYLYYYTGVFLERKLDVQELLSQFIKKTHSIQRPISFTLDFIREKFSSNNQFSKKFDDNDDDDLIISSVLPISLLCPVGRSRITCPLRGLNCHHLQCFDAHLYLMMNERRSIWKCPVCDSQATLTELFVDEYFQQILRDFEQDDDITDINVNPDGTYVAVIMKESRENRHQNGNVEKPLEFTEPNNSSNANSTESQPLILIESDDDKFSTENKSHHSLKNFDIPCSSDIGPVKAVEAAHLPPEKQLSTIDLTSDSDDDIEPIKQNNTALINSVALTQPQNVIDNSHLINNRVILSKLLPKTKFGQSDNITLSPSLVLESNPLKGNSFQRLPVNCPLLVPTNNLSNMIFIPNQNYPYIYSKENTNKYISQSFVNKHQLSQPNSYSITPTSLSYDVMSSSAPPIITSFHSMAVPSKPSFAKSSIPPPVTSITNSHFNIVRSPSNATANNKIKKPLKLDPSYDIIDSIKSGQKTKESKHRLESDSSTSSKKHKIKRDFSQLIARKERPRGSRTSSRIQKQTRKTYIETSGSSNDDASWDDDFSNLGSLQFKRDNPFNDSESGSSCEDRKRRRLVREQSSDEETATKSDIINEIMKNSQFPIICLTRLDEDVFQRYLNKE